MQSLPNKGIASDTWGNVSATRLRNTVSDRRIVTPETKEFRFRFEKYNNNHTKTNDTIKMEIKKRTFMYVQVFLYPWWRVCSCTRVFVDISRTSGRYVGSVFGQYRFCIFVSVRGFVFRSAFRAERIGDRRRDLFSLLAI